MPALFWLWTRLFRGVTPDRHAGETSLAAVHAWLAYSGYPLDLDMSCKESPDCCGTCAICRTATAACLFTTSGSVVFLEFSHSQEDKPMNNDIIELRLTAIEAAIKTISAAICANEGPLSDDLHNQIQLLRDQLSSPENTVKQEAITYQTIKLLDSLNCDPWDPF